MSDAWHNGTLFGIGVLAAVLGVLKPPPPPSGDWTGAIIGALVMVLAVCLQWRAWKRKEEGPEGTDAFKPR